MTHAGTITVGVDIDANGLGEKLAAVVRSQLAPALGKLGQDLSRVNTGSSALDGVTKAATQAAKATEQTAKSTEKVTAATDRNTRSSDKNTESKQRQTRATDDLEKSTRLVERTQNDLNAAIDIFGKKSPQAEAAAKRLARAQDAHTDVLVRAAAASKSSTDSQIQDIERLTAAAEASARRHAELQRTFSIGGGGGGRGGGGNRTGFFGGGGIGGFLTSPGGLGAAGLAANALPAAALVVTNLTGAIQQLAQTGAVLPGVVAGIVSSVGTAKLGFMGVGDAISEMYKAAKSGDPKDIKKAAEALKDLAPAATETVQSIGRVVPEFEKLRKDFVQQNMFDGIGKSIEDVSGRLMPTFKTGLGGIATAWNGTFKTLLGAVGSDSSKSFLDRIFGNTAEGQKRANAAIEPLIHGLGQLATTGSNFLPRLGDGLAKITTRFDTFITKAAADGRLDKWIDQGLNAVASLGNSFLNIGKIIGSLTEAAGGDGGFFKLLETGTGKLADFLASAEGQEKLTRFFNDARQTLGQWIPILGNIANVVGDVFKGLQDWGGILLPVLGQVTGFLSSMPGLVQTAVTAFAGFKTLGWLAGLFGGGGLGGPGGGAGGRGGGPGAIFGGRGLLGLLGGITAANMGSDLLNPRNPDGSPAAPPSALNSLGGLGANVGGGALSGALVAGAPGAIVGAIAGLGASIYDRIKGDIDRGRQEWEQKWQADRNNPDRPGSPETANAVTGRDKILQPSLSTPPVSSALLPAIAAGQVRGYSIGPGGQVIGPDGQPVNIPGLDGRLKMGPLPAAPVVQAPAPAVPPMPPPPKPGSGLAGLFPNLPGAPGVPTPTISGQDPAQTIASLATSIKQLPEGKVEIKADDIPKVKDDLSKLNVQIDDVSKNQIVVKANASDAQATIDALIRNYQSKTIQIQVQASVGGGAPTVPVAPGHADGGVLPGYSPGVDNMLVPMAGGEGVVIPEAMRALGGSWLYNLNSRFRGGISRRGYAAGGVVGADGAFGLPDNSVIGLLTQIRDAIQGKGGGALATTADNTTTMAQALGPKMKPFGGDVGKGALAGAIRALGGDPNQMDWGGFNGDGQLLVPKGMSAGQFGGGGGNLPALASVLSAFARSGNIGDLAGSGLNVNSPVVTAITAARNKRKGLGDDDIAGLVQQVLTGGGYSGVLDSTNTLLVKSLTKFQQQQLTGRGGGGLPAGGFDAALLSQIRPGQYTQGQADLTKGLADCSSSVEDLVNLMDGMPTAGREMSTGNAAQWLTSRGFVPGTMPGAFNVGFNGGHMQATLPDGTPFNWGSDAAAARGGVGGTGAFDPSFTQQFYRPVGGLPLGAGAGLAAGPLGYSGGGPVPVYIVNGPGGDSGPLGKIGGQLVGDAISAAGAPVSDAVGSIISGIDQGTQLERNSTKNLPAVRTGTLMKEGNPLSVAALAGYQVPDFTRQGWSGDVMGNSGPGYTAGGQMMSDTASLIMRTFTDTQAAADARQQQMLAVLDQIKTQLSEQVLKPIIQSAVQSAMAAAGQAAQQGASGAGGGVIPGLADGGAVWGGVAGVDSVPLMGMPGEHMLTTKDVSAMGGQRGVYAFRAALHRNGGMRGFAGGGGIGNDTVGADFFGVSQVPIIGDIINLIVKILLKVIGVEIQVRDTMNRMSDDFRQFRGDFKAFDASGRLMNDTSGLVDRSGSSEETVVAERVRIFKQVLEGLIKFIIQKIVIPITQAIASSLLQAGASAAGGAAAGGINTVAPGAGGIAGSLITSLISSGGQAGINIIGEIAQQLVGAATGPLVGLLTDGFMGIFGKLLNPLLTGGIGGLLTAFLPFLAFDEGGIAAGQKGFLPKATIEPERVLSPRQTTNHERLTELLDSGVLDRIAGDNSRRIDVSGGIHLYGDQAKPEVVVNHLMALLD